MTFSLFFCQLFPGACSEGTLPPNSTPLHPTSLVQLNSPWAFHSSTAYKLASFLSPTFLLKEGCAMMSHPNRGFDHLLRDVLNNTQPAFELTLAKNKAKTMDSFLLEDDTSQLP